MSTRPILDFDAFVAELCTLLHADSMEDAARDVVAKLDLVASEIDDARFNIHVGRVGDPIDSMPTAQDRIMIVPVIRAQNAAAARMSALAAWREARREVAITMLGSFPAAHRWLAAGTAAPAASICRRPKTGDSNGKQVSL